MLLNYSSRPDHHRHWKGWIHWQDRNRNGCCRIWIPQVIITLETNLFFILRIKCFLRNGKYDLDFKNPASDPATYLESNKLAELYQEFIKDFPMVSIEDPFDQDDWAAWTSLTGNTPIQVKRKDYKQFSIYFNFWLTFIICQIVGDDLTVTNPKRIQMAVDCKACNCLLLKVNQIGTVTESIAAHKLAKANGWGTMVSHRSGETEDSFIGDLVVGLSTGQVK